MKKQSSKVQKKDPPSRKSLKARTTPSPNPVRTEDQLTQSAVNQEFMKTQQSFRSSNSGVGQSQSVSSRITQTAASPPRGMQKRPSQIISKQQLSNMHERSIIKAYGLNMEAVCPKANHEKNKMIFICQNQDCKADNRLGCAYCQVEQHNDHSTSIMEIQTFCKIFDDRKKQFNQLASTIMKVPDKATPIKFFFEKLRAKMLDRLQQIETNILESVQEQLKWKPLETDIVNKINNLGAKNIFEMTQDELKESLQFIAGKHLQELEFMKQETNNYLSEKIDQVDKTLEDYCKQVDQDLTNTLNDNNQVEFLKPDSKEFAMYKLSFFEKKQQTFSELSQPFSQVIKSFQEAEKKEEEKRQAEIQMQKEIEEKKKQEEIQKQQEIQKKIEEEIIKQKELSKKKEKNSERERLLRTFPFQIYTEECGHRLQCNTIPIFACCNKAYPCARCHGFHAHPPVLTMPSYRYCMKCLEIYLVMFPTNQSVNCLKCQK